MYIPFNELKKDSRIWVFQVNRKLSKEEFGLLNEELQSFTNSWAAHGNPLDCSFIIQNYIHLIVGVDISVNAASGCSIDALVRKIQDIGNKLNVDFFDRKTIAYEKDGNVDVASFTDIKHQIETGEFLPTTQVYNPLIDSKARLDQDWKIDAEKSWLRRYFQKVY